MGSRRPAYGCATRLFPPDGKNRRLHLQGRHLHRTRRRWTRHAVDHPPGLRHAPRVDARRPTNRLRLQPRRRLQHLRGEPRRRRPPRRLTTHSAAEYPEAVTSDGRVLYSANIQPDRMDSQFPSGQFPQIYSVSLDGGRPELYSPSPCRTSRSVRRATACSTTT